MSENNEPIQTPRFSEISKAIEICNGKIDEDVDILMQKPGEKRRRDVVRKQVIQDVLGISPSTLNRMQNGKKDSFEYDLLYKFCEYTSLTPDEIFFGDPIVFPNRSDSEIIRTSSQLVTLANLKTSIVSSLSRHVSNKISGLVEQLLSKSVSELTGDLVADFKGNPGRGVDFITEDDIVKIEELCSDRVIFASNEFASSFYEEYPTGNLFSKIEANNIVRGVGYDYFIPKAEGMNDSEKYFKFMTDLLEKEEDKLSFKDKFSNKKSNFYEIPFSPVLCLVFHRINSRKLHTFFPEVEASYLPWVHYYDKDPYQGYWMGHTTLRHNSSKDMILLPERYALMAIDFFNEIRRDGDPVNVTGD